MRIIQDSDKLVIIAGVKGEENTETILKPGHIPNTTTKLMRYFDYRFPNAKRRNLNPGIQIALDSDQSYLQEQLRYELVQNDIHLYLKSIQHGYTAKKIT